MEVMESREAVEDATTAEEIETLREENEEKVLECVAGLEGVFEKVAGRSSGWDETIEQEAVSLAVRLRYLVNIHESIRGWEQGKGGGAVHH